MSNEPNKPIPAQELTEKELEGVSGGGDTIIMPGRRYIVSVSAGGIGEEKQNHEVAF